MLTSFPGRAPRVRLGELSAGAQDD